MGRDLPQPNGKCQLGPDRIAAFPTFPSFGGIRGGLIGAFHSVAEQLAPWRRMLLAECARLGRSGCERGRDLAEFFCFRSGNDAAAEDGSTPDAEQIRAVEVRILRQTDGATLCRRDTGSTLEQKISFPHQNV